MATFLCCDLEISAANPEEIYRTVLMAVSRRDKLGIHVVNTYTLSIAATDPNFAKTLRGSALRVADSVPLVWFAKKTKQVGVDATASRGPSLMRSIISCGRADNIRHFFYGSTEETLHNLKARVSGDFPGAVICGVYSPPFVPSSGFDLEDLVARLRASQADVLWVGLGTPKQDVVVANLTSQYNVVAIAVGAAFDFLSGAKSEAPTLLQGSGFEWIYRLLSEPRRLWRRYLIRGPSFVFNAGVMELRRRRRLHAVR